MTWIAAGVAAGGSALIAGAQYGVGKYNQAQAAKNRPKYEIPDEVYKNLNQAQTNALQGLPEAQKQQYLNNLQQSSAYALQQDSSRKGGLAGVAAINQQQNKGLQDLAAQDSAARMNNQQQLYAQRNQLADYKGQQFQLDKLNPYYEKIASNQALNGALFQNLNNAVGMGTSIGLNGAKKSVAMQGSPQQSNYFNPSSFNNSGAGNYGGYDSIFNKNGVVPDGSYDISNIG